MPEGGKRSGCWKKGRTPPWSPAAASRVQRLAAAGASLHLTSWQLHKGRLMGHGWPPDAQDLRTGCACCACSG